MMMGCCLAQDGCRAAGVTTFRRGRCAQLDLKKEPVETELHTAVCKGQVTLAAAQQAIVTDLTTALTALHLG